MKHRFEEGDEECDHDWDVDSNSGHNFVSGLNHKLDLRMRCNECNTAIWVKQYAICDSSEGNPSLCKHCHDTKSDCDCIYGEDK